MRATEFAPPKVKTLLLTWALCRSWPAEAPLRFATAPSLISQPVDALRLHVPGRALKQWSRYDLAAIDEIGYAPIAEIGAEYVFQVSRTAIFLSPHIAPGCVRALLGYTLGLGHLVGQSGPDRVAKRRSVGLSDLGLQEGFGGPVNRSLNTFTRSLSARFGR